MAKKHDAKGRSKGGGRYVMLTHHMLDTPAGKSLKPQELAVLVRVMQIHNGANNGKIAMSCRRVAELANVSKDTAAKCLSSLIVKGFLRVTTPSAFGVNDRKAAEYEVTCIPLAPKTPAKNTFQHWQPDAQENSSSYIKDTTVLNQGQKPDLRVVGC